jgi:hypothetical protein
MISSYSANNITLLSNALSRANVRERKCRVERHFRIKIENRDIFYHILASDLRKIEERELYGRSDKSGKFFRRRF